MLRNKLRIGFAVVVQIGQESIEQGHITARLDGEMQIGKLSRGRPARIDHDNFCAARFFRGHQALKQYRMTPGEIGTDQHHEISKFQILIISGNHISPESPLVAGNRGRHAETAVGVDIGRTDETLHQLVGNVIVFCQQLAGNIKGNRVRSMLRNGLAEFLRNEIKCLVPRCAFTRNFGKQQAVIKRKRFGQGRALGA